MKKGDKKTKIAGSGEKVLPGNSGISAQEGESRRETGSVLPAGQILRADDGSILAPAAAQRSAAPVTSLSEAAGSPITDFRMRTVERTQDMVALHAMRLCDTGNEALHVVIKPGAGLQISLLLQQQDDGVHVEAVLQRGDFDYLHAHWAELQQDLETRGVRVAALVASGDFVGTGANSFEQQQSQQSKETDALTSSAFAEFASKGSVIETHSQTVSRTKSHHGWESWA